MIYGLYYPGKIAKSINKFTENCMRKLNNFLIIIFIFAFISASVGAADNQIIVKGDWGKKPDQLGISLLAPGVMPTAPFMGIGGYDVSSDGRLFVADSVNRQIKTFQGKEWRETMINAQALGEVCFSDNKLYLISKNPDGIMVFDTASEKIEKQIKVSFKSPGRIACLDKDLLAVEELGGGVWLVKGDKSTLHPAVALQACGNQNAVYGLQKDLLGENLQIIKAEISKEAQEPEVIHLIENETRTVFARLAGLIGNDPVIITVSENDPVNLKFTRVGAENKSISLPALDGPYLISSWKLCSDGSLYGFSGHASEGFKFIKSGKNFRP